MAYKLLLHIYLTMYDGDACAAKEQAFDDFHAIGFCTWDTATEDGECFQEASDVLQTLYFACTEKPDPCADPYTTLDRAECTEI